MKIKWNPAVGIIFLATTGFAYWAFGWKGVVLVILLSVKVETR